MKRAALLGVLLACGTSSNAPDGGTDGAAADVATDAVDACAMETGICTPNATEACACEPGAIRRCAADGHAWEACGATTYASQFYVAPNGNDQNAGTIDAPFLTLERAQTAVRALAHPLTGNVVVWLRGGIYPRASSFALTNADSGSATASVVYRGYGGEVARVSGAVPLSAANFSVVTSQSSVWSRVDPSAQGKLMAIDLTGLAIKTFGTLQTRTTTGISELFFNGTRMPLGRWPDAPADDSLTALQGSFESVATVTSTTSFTIADDRVGRWTNAPDAWVHGEFGYAWSDTHSAIASVNASTKTITMKTAPTYGLTATVTQATASPFYAYNLLEEITSPGEWYLDRTSNILYFWPPSDLAQAEIMLSTLQAPLVTMTNAEYVTLQEITFEDGERSLLTILGGDHDVLDGCSFHNAGGDAITISGSQNGVTGALVDQAGDQGVVVNGGDRPSLTQAQNFVEASAIHHFGRWDWMYKPAIDLNGNGNVARHNVLHDSPHAAILYSGSQHTMELNEIYDVCASTSDAGAIYSGRDWSARGNAISQNYIHDIQSWITPANGVHAIYLDDCISGIKVYANVVDHIDGFGILAGGGRDNHMTNNLLLNAGFALYSDERCTNPGTITNIPNDSWNMLQKLEAVNYQADPWATTYPECAAIPDDYATVTAQGSHWLFPEGSTFTFNIGFGDATFLHDSGSSTTHYASYANNQTSTDPMFVDPNHPLLGLQPSSPLNGLVGFDAIPFDQIGIVP